ncbi:hypothetical protein [Microbulbifer sp. THAF38]|uniref:hypothetical protein n=1 Tax=Microbulbifer sp. THAF38 TaxID=2587856 RepID=UPI0012685008|nr:hypothetical protein [Microbulbifer sp. THAF38]
MATKKAASAAFFLFLEYAVSPQSPYLISAPFYTGCWLIKLNVFHQLKMALIYVFYKVVSGLFSKTCGFFDVSYAVLVNG